MIHVVSGLQRLRADQSDSTILPLLPASAETGIDFQSLQ